MCMYAIYAPIDKTDNNLFYNETLSFIHICLLPYYTSPCHESTYKTKILLQFHLHFESFFFSDFNNAHGRNNNYAKMNCQKQSPSKCMYITMRFRNYKKFSFGSCFPSLLVSYICSRDLPGGWDSFGPFAKDFSPDFIFIFKRRGIIQYLEYLSVCPFVRIASPRPLSRKRVCPPSPETNAGGGQHLLAGKGARGANLDDWRESLALCLLCDFKLWY